MSALSNLVRAAAGALPFIPRGSTLPDRTMTVGELPIDRENVAAYAAVTGLRYGDTVPLTYPFALTFPTVMELITGFDFPFPAMGSVHVENHITQHRPIAVTDTVSVRTRAQNMREHRKGLLVDVLTDVAVGNDTAWSQVTTFLHQQRTSLSGEPKPEPVKQPKLPPPNSILRITPGQIRRYASVGGPQPDPHQYGRRPAVRIPDRDCARNVQCRSSSGEHRGTDPGCGPLFGQIRQTHPATGQRRAVRRSRAGRLGSGAAQHEQGLSAPDG